MHVLEEARGENVIVSWRITLIFAAEKPILKALSLWLFRRPEYGIAVISVHTNWDKAREGVNASLQDLAERELSPLLPMENSEGLGMGIFAKPCLCKI